MATAIVNSLVNAINSLQGEGDTRVTIIGTIMKVLEVKDPKRGLESRQKAVVKALEHASEEKLAAVAVLLNMDALVAERLPRIEEMNLDESVDEDMGKVLPLHPRTLQEVQEIEDAPLVLEDEQVERLAHASADRAGFIEEMRRLNAQKKRIERLPEGREKEAFRVVLRDLVEMAPQTELLKLQEDVEVLVEEVTAALASAKMEESIEEVLSTIDREADEVEAQERMSALLQAAESPVVNEPLLTAMLAEEPEKPVSDVEIVQTVQAALALVDSLEGISQDIAEPVGITVTLLTRAHRKAEQAAKGKVKEVGVQLEEGEHSQKLYVSQFKNWAVKSGYEYDLETFVEKSTQEERRGLWAFAGQKSTPAAVVAVPGVMEISLGEVIGAIPVIVTETVQTPAAVKVVKTKAVPVVLDEPVLATIEVEIDFKKVSVSWQPKGGTHDGRLLVETEGSIGVNVLNLDLYRAYQEGLPQKSRQSIPEFLKSTSVAEGITWMLTRQQDMISAENIRRDFDKLHRSLTAVGRKTLGGIVKVLDETSGRKAVLAKVEATRLRKELETRLMDGNLDMALQVVKEVLALASAWDVSWQTQPEFRPTLDMIEAARKEFGKQGMVVVTQPEETKPAQPAKGETVQKEVKPEPVAVVAVVGGLLAQFAPIVGAMSSEQQMGVFIQLNELVGNELLKAGLVGGGDLGTASTMAAMAFMAGKPQEGWSAMLGVYTRPGVKELLERELTVEVLQSIIDSPEGKPEVVPVLVIGADVSVVTEESAEAHARNLRAMAEIFPEPKERSSIVTPVVTEPVAVVVVEPKAEKPKGDGWLKVLVASMAQRLNAVDESVQEKLRPMPKEVKAQFREILSELRKATEGMADGSILSTKATGKVMDDLNCLLTGATGLAAKAKARFEATAKMPMDGKEVLVSELRKELAALQNGKKAHLEAMLSETWNRVQPEYEAMVVLEFFQHMLGKDQAQAMRLQSLFAFYLGRKAATEKSSRHLPLDWDKIRLMDDGVATIKTDKDFIRLSRKAQTGDEASIELAKRVDALRLGTPQMDLWSYAPLTGILRQDILAVAQALKNAEVNGKHLPGLGNGKAETRGQLVATCLAAVVHQKTDEVSQPKGWKEIMDSLRSIKKLEAQAQNPGGRQIIRQAGWFAYIGGRAVLVSLVGVVSWALSPVKATYHVVKAGGEWMVARVSKTRRENMDIQAKADIGKAWDNCKDVVLVPWSLLKSGAKKAKDVAIKGYTKVAGLFSKEKTVKTEVVASTETKAGFISRSWSSVSGVAKSGYEKVKGILPEVGGAILVGVTAGVVMSAAVVSATGAAIIAGSAIVGAGVTFGIRKAIGWWKGRKPTAPVPAGEIRIVSSEPARAAA